MPANTPRGYPYPLPTEPVAEGAQAIRNLAEAIDASVRINEQKLTSLSPSLTFGSIPQTFTHLRIVASLRCDRNDNYGAGYLRFNNISGTTYVNQRLRVSGTISQFESISDSGMHLAFTGGINTPSLYGPLVIDIPDYREPGKLRTALSSGVFPNARGLEWCVAFLPSVTTAISQLSIHTDGTSQFYPGSKASLYGLP